MKNPHAIVQRILNLIILNTPGIPQLGLLDGRTGICLLLYEYSKKINSAQIESYAGDLLDSIIEELNIYLPSTFISGLAGIGWSIEYLKQNHYISGDTNDLLSNIDISIFQLDKKKPLLERYYQDFYGYGLYYLARTQGDNKPDEQQEMLQLLLTDINDILQNERKIENVSLYYLVSFSYVVDHLIKRHILSPNLYNNLKRIILINLDINSIDPVSRIYLSELGLIDSAQFNIEFTNILTSASLQASYDIVFNTIRNNDVDNLFISPLNTYLENESDWKQIINQTGNAFGFLYGCSGWSWLLLKQYI